jgi:HPt (histidine-containing phosphotransfer) domain-containing protein
MADHVGKPVARLFSALAISLLRKPSMMPVGVPAQAAEASSDMQDAVLLERLAALPGLDIKQGLAAVRGRVGSYARLLRKYAEGEVDGLGHLAERLTACDQQEARRLAHSLKGSSGTLGVVAVQRLALALEVALREGRDSGAEVLALEAELGRVVPAILSAIPAETVAAPSATVSRDDVLSTLRELEILLADGDTEVGRRMSQVAQLLRPAFGEQVGELERLIDGFQYPQALDKVRAWLQQK